MAPLSLEYHFLREHKQQLFFLSLLKGILPKIIFPPQKISCYIYIQDVKFLIARILAFDINLIKIPCVYFLFCASNVYSARINQTIVMCFEQGLKFSSTVMIIFDYHHT